MALEGSFTYTYVSSDLSDAIKIHSASKSGGLDRDELRLMAETHFSQATTQEFRDAHDKQLSNMFGSKGLKSPGSFPGLAASVEIIVLQLPTPKNGFIGVSMYCDQNGKSKGYSLNTRASSLCHQCGHINEIYGDVFIGRYHDDESMDWERLDFGLEDMNSDASWMIDARATNEGRKSGAYSTSGVLQNMLNKDNTEVVDGEKLDYQQKIKDLGDHTESDILQWSQSADEVELRIKAGKDVKKGDINVKFNTAKLQITVRNLPYDTNDSSPASRIFSPYGAELFGSIDPDCSAWTLDRNAEGDVTIICTLAKARTQQWSQLTK